MTDFHSQYGECPLRVKSRHTATTFPTAAFGGKADVNHSPAEGPLIAIADGADALPLNTKIKELEGRQKELQDMLDHASAPEPLIHPKLAEIYRAKIENLSSLIYDPQFKAETFDIIRSLIDEVRLIPENGDLRTELKGELAGMLSLCDAKKRPATSYEERAEQIKMVAGARCHLYRTRTKWRRC